MNVDPGSLVAGICIGVIVHWVISLFTHAPLDTEIWPGGEPRIGRDAVDRITEDAEARRRRQYLHVERGGAA